MGGRGQGDVASHWALMRGGWWGGMVAGTCHSYTAATARLIIHPPIPTLPLRTFGGLTQLRVS